MSKDPQAALIQKLVETGEYEKMKKALREKLRDGGWFDDVNQLALDELSGSEDPNFDKITNKLEPKAFELVPEDVKIEMLKMIKSFLEQHVEKAP